MWFSKIKDLFFPVGVKGRKLIALFFAILVLKFLLLDLLWCMQSTFTPFSKIETYADTILISLLLLLPLVCFRAVKTTLIIFFLLDCLFVANLMYFRTYFTPIPLDSYLLISNLSDFTTSVFDSLRLVDLFFPLSTVVAGVLWEYKFKEKQPVEQSETRRNGLVFIRYFLLILLISLIPAVRIWSQKGFKVAYERLQDAYLHTCNVPMYTIFGSLYYDYTCDNIVYTPEIEDRIDYWLANKSDLKSDLLASQ